MALNETDRNEVTRIVQNKLQEERTKQVDIPDFSRIDAHLQERYWWPTKREVGIVIVAFGVCATVALFGFGEINRESARTALKALLAEKGAPDLLANIEQANRAATEFLNNGIFGEWTDQVGLAQTATEDGFLAVFGGTDFRIKTGTKELPDKYVTDKESRAECIGQATTFSSLIPIRKDDYWKVYLTEPTSKQPNFRFLPLKSSRASSDKAPIASISAPWFGPIPASHSALMLSVLALAVTLVRRVPGRAASAQTT